MKFDLQPGPDAQPIEAPTATTDVPIGFLDALKAAKKFAGSHAKHFPAGTYVHIAGDKLYATNNRHLVEIEIGADVGHCLLSKSDIDALAAMGDGPERLSIFDNAISFEWPDGRWAKFQTQPVAFDWQTEFKNRIEAHWSEGRPTVTPSPKAIDKHVKSSRRDPIAFDLPHLENGRLGRVVVFPNGIFFRGDQSKISGLIGDGSFDPRLDDVFAEAIAETKATQRSKEKQIERLLSRISTIERQIEEISTESEHLDQRLRDQHEAVAKYQSGEDLDEVERAILTPVCPDLSSQARREEVENEFEQHEVPEGWEVTDKRLRDDFIYVTIRRPRVTRKVPDA